MLYQRRGLKYQGGTCHIHHGFANGDKGFCLPVLFKSVKPELAHQPSATQALAEEARLLRQVRHPGIPVVMDFLPLDDTPTLVLEHIEGVSLAELMAELPPDAPRRALLAREVLVQTSRILYDVGQSLGSPLIHGDLSPANLVLSGSKPLVTLIDFGQARVGEDAAQHRPVCATPGYHAPELSRTGPTTLADIHALGRIVLTLAPNGEPEVTALATAMADPDPAARPRDWRSVLLRMGEPTGQVLTLPGCNAPPTPGSVTAPLEPPRRRRVWPLAAILAVCLSVAVAALVLLLAPPAPEPAQLSVLKARGGSPGQVYLYAVPPTVQKVTIDNRQEVSPPFPRSVTLAPGLHLFTFHHGDGTSRQHLLTTNPGQAQSFRVGK